MAKKSKAPDSGEASQLRTSLDDAYSKVGAPLMANIARNWEAFEEYQEAELRSAEGTHTNIQDLQAQIEALSGSIERQIDGFNNRLEKTQKLLQESIDSLERLVEGSAIAINNTCARFYEMQGRISGGDVDFVLDPAIVNPLVLSAATLNALSGMQWYPLTLRLCTGIPTNTSIEVYDSLAGKPDIAATWTAGAGVDDPSVRLKDDTNSITPHISGGAMALEIGINCDQTLTDAHVGLVTVDVKAVSGALSNVSDFLFNIDITA